MPPYFSGSQNQSGRVIVHLVRRDIHRLHDLADRALFDQIASLHSRLDLKALGVHDREHLARLGRDLTHFRQLFKRRQAGLSLKKSLPCLIALIPNGARRYGIGAPAMSWIEGRSGSRLDWREFGIG